jgi:hypothetical protein
VEQTLGAHGVPVTTLRAGIVIGLRGSSYGMFRSVLERLPLIFCPSWANSLIQPIALSDVISLLVFCLQHPGGQNRSFDIGSPDILTYRELLQRSARILGLKRWFIRVRFPMLGLSKIFLTLISGFPRQLVSPLVESLKHSLRARDLRLQEQAGLPGISFAQSVHESLQEEKNSSRFKTVHSFLAHSKHRIPAAAQKTVRSVQRISLPPGKTARWLALQYTTWLPRFFHVLLCAETDSDGNLTIRSRFPNLKLLELCFAGERSITADRQLFYITGGLLAKKTAQPTRRPRLELREVLNGSAALVAIHDYRPTIPWPLYNLTQARVHLWVMKNFARAITGSYAPPSQAAHKSV